jgi:Fe2+ or Zn2+ uptake regulation protein
MVSAIEATNWAQRLRTVGLRVTQSRLAVLNAVHADPHIAADQVGERVRADIGPVSTQAVYDALNTLTEYGILRRFEPAGSSMRFETNAGDNHHHLVCRRCGAVADVPCAVEAIPCAVPEDTQGFLVQEAEVTYWGLCAACSPASDIKNSDPIPTRRNERND